jgi:hypothetical protein
MAIEVLTGMLDRTGRCPLPVHDSFLVAETDADTLSRTMTEVASEHGLQLGLKESRDRTAEYGSVGNGIGSARLRSDLGAREIVATPDRR